ncbi:MULTISPECIES: helix-turn-helix domain-containing protein [unclassified Streptomyces]|uniref:helix-turn-helix domain-containing protein n=1 Tax=unclassified Streptomyces TaxID=2593676 RepID=UPI004041BB28
MMPLAHHFARRYRGHGVTLTPAAERALTAYDWPENVRQLRQVIRDAASRTEVTDTRHFRPRSSPAPSGAWVALQELERDEIVRCLAEPGITVAQAAERLGMSRASVYRKVARYGIKMPDRTIPSRPDGVHHTAQDRRILHLRLGPALPAGALGIPDVRRASTLRRGSGGIPVCT